MGFIAFKRGNHLSLRFIRREFSDRGMGRELFTRCVKDFDELLISIEMCGFQMMGEPVISVDTKKKELVGNYKNVGAEWEPNGSPAQVKTHDFVDPKLGKAIPYGVYDLHQNQAWVSVGIDHADFSQDVEKGGFVRELQWRTKIMLCIWKFPQVNLLIPG